MICGAVGVSIRQFPIFSFDRAANMDYLLYASAFEYRDEELRLDRNHRSAVILPRRIFAERTVLGTEAFRRR